MKFKKAFELTQRTHWNSERFKESGHAQDVWNLWEKNIKKHFQRKDVHSVTGKEIQLWHKEIGKRSIYVANRSLSVLSKIYTTLIHEGHIDYNPCVSVRRFTEGKRAVVITEDVIAKLGKVLNEFLEQSPSYSPKVLFVYLLIFSGARPSSIERATFNDIEYVNYKDQEYTVLTLAGKKYAKTGEKDTIILPPKITELLKIRQVNCIHPNKSLTGIKMPRGFWKRLKEIIGCPDYHLRDWRRTFASMALKQGVPLEMVGDLLNHKSIQTTKRYAISDTEMKIDAVNLVANKMNSLVFS